jgi:hypothetical protein
VGQPLDRAALVRLLSNVLYRGEVRHKGMVYPGEQAAIVEQKVWQQAQILLGQSKSRQPARKRPGTLLEDLRHLEERLDGRRRVCYSARTA